MTDNSLGQARPLGALGAQAVTRQDVVGPSDRLDFYKFTLNRSSSVRFQLSNLQANADLLLLNSAGQLLVQSSKGGNGPELVNRQLAAGTYYVQVLSRSNNTAYKLTGLALAGTNAAVGTRNNPVNLGNLSQGSFVQVRDIAGSLSSAKIYKFQLGQISNVSLALSRVAGGGTMRLYYDINRNGRLDPSDSPSVAFGEGSESFNRPISKVLPATGTYFLEIDRNLSASTMRYNLTANVIPVPGNIPRDPGSEPTTAYNLGTLNSGGRLVARDYVGQIDITDIYRFNLRQTGNVTFSKRDVAGDINVQVSIYRDANNNRILESNEFIGQLFGSQGSINLQSGNYYLSVSQSNLSNTAYSVTLET